QPTEQRDGSNRARSRVPARVRTLSAAAPPLARRPMRENLLRLCRRWRLLVIATLANLLVSSIAAVPWSEAVRGGSLSAFPDPDAALFAEGGMLFVEWLRID